MRPRSRRPRLYTRIAFRILAFNVLLAFLPVAAFLLLDTYERGLVDSLENALAQQARITAAWLGQAELDAPAARRAVAAIGDRRTARFRVVDRGGNLLADSSEPSAAVPADQGPAAAENGRDRSALPEDSAVAQESILYRLFALPTRISRRLLEPPSPPLGSADFYANSKRLDGVELREALGGRYGAATRVSSGGQVSVTLYSAVPVTRGSRVVGAVLVSQSTYRILRDLYQIRLDAARIFLESLLAAALISALLALTIVGPLARLRTAAAAALETRLGTASAFPDSRRGDEIGDLERALRGLFLRLDERLLQTERFAADAAHEFRNPLAAIRSAAELAEGSQDAADRSRFHRAIIEDAERLRSLVEGLRRLSAAEAETGSREAIDLAAAARAACHRAGRAREGIEARVDARAEIFVSMEPSRLDAILDNLLDNAFSFAAKGVELELGLEEREAGPMARLVVKDDGPGLPPEHLGRVFDRFFTWRPGKDRAAHTGLGLSLAKALAEAEGGSIAVENRRPAEGGDAPAGAAFSLRLPALKSG